MTTKEDKKAFLSRWSRLKQEAKDQPPPKAADLPLDAKAPPPELPPLDKLTFDSDYRAFFHPKVDEDVRRAALKKLFSDQRFNVMDGLDVYIDDYSKSDPIPPAMLAGLRQAQKILEWAKGQDEEKKDAPAECFAARGEPVALEESSTPSSRVPPSGERPAEDPLPAADEPQPRGPTG